MAELAAAADTSIVWTLVVFAETVKIDSNEQRQVFLKDILLLIPILSNSIIIK